MNVWKQVVVMGAAFCVGCGPADMDLDETVGDESVAYDETLSPVDPEGTGVLDQEMEAASGIPGPSNCPHSRTATAQLKGNTVSMPLGNVKAVAKMCWNSSGEAWVAGNGTLSGRGCYQLRWKEKIGSEWTDWKYQSHCQKQPGNFLFFWNSKDNARKRDVKSLQLRVKGWVVVPKNSKQMELKLVPSIWR